MPSPIWVSGSAGHKSAYLGLEPRGPMASYGMTGSFKVRLAGLSKMHEPWTHAPRST